MSAATAAAFAGIHNENEFYSHYHLSEIFTGDIRATVDRWRETAEAEGGRTPYAALRALVGDFQFQNEKKLLTEPYHHALFSINVYGRPRTSPAFQHVANLFAPATVDACLDHDGRGVVPGLKDDNNDWNIAGHADRVVAVDVDALDSFAKLYDEPGTTPVRARLPALHAGTLLNVLQKLAAHPKRLGDLGDESCVTPHWSETSSQRDGTIWRETRFPTHPAELILSGPHLFVGNPFSKTPRRECNQKSDYDVLDLATLPDDYLPRTNYLPACEPADYRHAPFDRCDREQDYRTAWQAFARSTSGNELDRS